LNIYYNLFQGDLWSREDNRKW